MARSRAFTINPIREGEVPPACSTHGPHCMNRCTQVFMVPFADMSNHREGTMMLEYAQGADTVRFLSNRYVNCCSCCAPFLQVPFLQAVHPRVAEPLTGGGASVIEEGAEVSIIYSVGESAEAVAAQVCACECVSLSVALCLSVCCTVRPCDHTNGWAAGSQYGFVMEEMSPLFMYPDERLDVMDPTDPGAAAVDPDDDHNLRRQLAAQATQMRRVCVGLCRICAPLMQWLAGGPSPASCGCVHCRRAATW